MKIAYALCVQICIASQSLSQSKVIKFGKVGFFGFWVFLKFRRFSDFLEIKQKNI